MGPAVTAAASSFEPPTDRAWAIIRRRALRLFQPHGFPLSITRTRRRPSWAGPLWDAGVFFDMNDDGSVASATIWIHAKHSRAAALDCLWHELAHVLVAEIDPTDELAHDDRFWIKHGEVYRTWMRDKYGSRYGADKADL